jgi:DNA polymerase
VTEPRAAAALAKYLRTRSDVEGLGLFVPRGEREQLLDRLRGMGTPSAPARGSHRVGGPVSSGDVERLACQAAAEEIEALEDLDTVRAVAERCVRCQLHETRQHVVFADGSPDARVMCVGEAPGANEDETGLPFVGRAGQLLDRLLLSVGFRREDVYICNVIKCRPPGNRNPLEEEIERCSPFLRRQVALVAPEVIVAFGTFASRTLLDMRESLGRMRGRTHSYGGVPLIVTYHPAALLRNPNWTRPAWEDLQRVRRLLEEDAGG